MQSQRKISIQSYHNTDEPEHRNEKQIKCNKQAEKSSNCGHLTILRVSGDIVFVDEIP